MLIDFIQKNMVFDKSRMLAGSVYVGLVIEADGSISETKIEHGLSPENDSEALRIIALMPKWKPATLKGKPMRQRVIIPMRFK